jgi:hypothetical protein
MAFGRLTRRFALFQRDMMNTLAMCSTIIQCAARLHNFIQDIDGNTYYQLQQPTNNNNLNNNNDEVVDLTFLPTMPEGATAHDDTRPRSHKRASILAEITGRDIRRPV